MNIKNNSSHTPELHTFVEEFFVLKSERIMAFLSGIVLIGIGIYSLLNTRAIIIHLIIIELACLCLGILIMLASQKRAVIKIAKNGLWTKSLDFKFWQDIRKVEIMPHKTVASSGGTRTEIELSIYLNFNKKSSPNENIVIDDLENFERIGELLCEFFDGELYIKYNH